MPSRDPDRPNILSILADDHGFWALGCAGNDEIQTPNLDRLAGEGLRLENSSAPRRCAVRRARAS